MATKKKRSPSTRVPKRPAKKAPARTATKAAAAPRRKAAAPMLLRAPAVHHHDPMHELYHEVSQFLYRQSELLDDQRWQDWIDLFTDDGIYWMPADPGDTTWEGVPSIFAEDKNLMTVRMKRVLHPDAWSQKPLWGTSHVIGNVVILPRDPKTGDIVVRSRFHMMELRRDSTRHFAGTYVHHLVRTPGGLKIRLQRTDMVNGQAAFDYVLQVWV